MNPGIAAVVAGGEPKTESQVFSFDVHLLAASLEESL